MINHDIFRIGGKIPHQADTPRKSFIQTVGVHRRIITDLPQKLIHIEELSARCINRLQRVGNCLGAVVYDDYAHNPEKLAAMWRTLADAYPKGVAVLWRPHGYGPLRMMLDALAAVFAQMKRPQDELLLLPVYDAGGTADRSVNTDVLAARIAGARMVSDLNEAETVLRKLASAVGASVTAGARDPGLPVLARRLAE